MTHTKQQRLRLQHALLTILFASILLVMASTPLGYLPLVVIKLTLLPLPVMLASLLLGSRSGLLMGFLFGLSSLVVNTLSPSLLSFAFSPLIPVYGQETGSPWALLIAFGPRLLLGLLPALCLSWSPLTRLFQMTGRRLAKIASLSGIVFVSSLLHTVTVLSLLGLCFGDSLQQLNGFDGRGLLSYLLGIAFGNGVLEAFLAAFLLPLVALPLMQHFQSKNRLRGWSRARISVKEHSTDSTDLRDSTDIEDIKDIKDIEDSEEGEERKL